MAKANSSFSEVQIARRIRGQFGYRKLLYVKAVF